MTLVFCSILADVVLCTYVYVGAVFLRIALGASAEMGYTFSGMLAAFVLVHIGSLVVFLAYDFGKTRATTDLAFSAVFGVIAGTAVSFIAAAAYLVYYAPDGQPIARSVFAAACVVNMGVLAGWRVWYTRQRRNRGDLHSRVIVVGTMQRVRDVADELQEYSGSGHEIVGCVITDPVIGKRDQLRDFLGHVDNLQQLPWLRLGATVLSIIV